jgi:hypothetical protein
MLISVPERLMTASSISTVACTSDRLGADETVVVAALVEPVMVSVALNVPTGTVIVMDVPSGFVITLAVAVLVPPVMVSPTEKPEESATARVIVPIG